MKSRAALSLSLLWVCTLAQAADDTRYFEDADHASYTIVWSPGQQSFGGLYEQPFLGAPNATLQIQINGQPPYTTETGVKEMDNGVFTIAIPDGRRKRVRLLFQDRPNGDPIFKKAGVVIVERCGPPQNGVYVDCTHWEQLTQVSKHK